MFLLLLLRDKRDPRIFRIGPNKSVRFYDVRLIIKRIAVVPLLRKGGQTGRFGEVLDFKPLSQDLR